MKRVWSKPELFTEEFQLDQHVALGCGVIRVVPGESVTGDACCFQAGGGGHWDLKNFTVVDTNKDGMITWDEVQAQAAARNGVPTGNGHQGHGLAFRLPDQEEIVPNLS